MKKILIIFFLAICSSSFCQTADEPIKYEIVTADNSTKVIEVIKIAPDRIFYWDTNGKKASYLRSELKSLKEVGSTKEERPVDQKRNIDGSIKGQEILKAIEVHGSEESLYTYCQIVGTQKFLSLKCTIAIDYGQERKFGEDNRVRDENGNVQSFNSMIDALNYMGDQGWDFVQAYVISMGNQNVYHYLLKKKK